MRHQSIASAADATGRWGVVALGLSIPISVAFDNVLLGVITLAWVAAGHFRNILELIRGNPVAAAAWTLFGLLALGTLYGNRNPGDGTHYLLKYMDLLLIPVFLTFFQDPKTRERALLAFGVTAVASVALAHLTYMNMLARNTLLLGFKDSITHSVIVGFSAFLFAVLAREEKNKTRRIGLAVLALLAAHNVIFMIIGRTGYLVVSILFFYFFIITFGRRGILFFIVAATATFLTAYHASDTFHQRVNITIEEATDWNPEKPSKTSVGLRLEFYNTSLHIVREHPLIGSGTGSVPAVYARAVSGHNMKETANPHNEYLAIAIQIGLIGLACLLYLFWRQWQFAGRLIQPLYRDLGRGLMLTFVAGCLFNSLLLDHTEGLLFAWMSALLFSSPTKPEAASAS